MRMKQEEAIVRTLVPYLTAFPDCRLDKLGLAVYAKALSDISPEVVNAAMMALIRTAKYFPRVSDILEQVRKLTDSVSDSGKPTAGQAWEEVMENVRRNGVYKPWEFSCPEVERAAQQFGKQELCSLEMRDVNTARAQFRDFYNRELTESENYSRIKNILAKLPEETLARIATKGQDALLPNETYNNAVYLGENGVRLRYK